MFKFWNDQKSHTRAKAREVFRLRGKTGEAGATCSSKNPLELTAKEDLIMALIGRDTAVGDGETPEFGLTTPIVKCFQ